MSNHESFNNLLEETAGQIYNAVVSAHERTPERELAWLGGYFQVEIADSSQSERPPAPFMHEVTVDYSPIPQSSGPPDVHPVLCFEYDEFGDFRTLDQWVDDNDDNNKVHTIFRDEAGQYREDIISSGDDEQYSNAAILRYLNPRQSGLFDSEAMAKYELKKQMQQTWLPLTPARIAQLIPMLKQAKADLTYLFS